MCSSDLYPEYKDFENCVNACIQGVRRAQSTSWKVQPPDVSMAQSTSWKVQPPDISRYLRQYKDAAVRVRVGAPNYDKIEDVEYDWLYMTYGQVREGIPEALPKKLGKEVVLTSYVDANLYHHLVTGRSVMGILHFVIGTPINWYSYLGIPVRRSTYMSWDNECGYKVNHATLVSEQGPQRTVLPPCA